MQDVRTAVLITGFGPFPGVPVNATMQLVPELALMLGMGLLLVPAGLLIFGWAERRAKRLGLLKRSG